MDSEHTGSSHWGSWGEELLRWLRVRSHPCTSGPSGDRLESGQKVALEVGLDGQSGEGGAQLAEEGRVGRALNTVPFGGGGTFWLCHDI